MILNNFKVKLLSFAVSSAVLTMVPNLASAKNFESEMVIIHPFQWTYDNVAKECTEYLGPAGFDAVQISQPAEHINNTQSWWAVYQPISFKSFLTMDGNEESLKNMIKTCNEAGVKVFADAVFNQRPNGGTGMSGAGFGGFNYPDGFTGSDFHQYNCSIGSYKDAWQVRNCALLGMADIATDNDATQDKIASYLKSLLDMGVYGFRIDAAKHMGYDDINAIIGKTEVKAGKRPPVYMEVIGNPEEAEDIQPNKYTFIDNSVVTDFTYVDRIKETFGSQNYGGALSFGLTLSSDDAEVFVNNHDDELYRCSAGTCSMPTQNNPDYNLAQSWLAVWPKGKVRQIYSGYSFTQHDPAGPIGAARCEGGWLCQHRVPFVLNSPRFARATRATAVSSSGYDNNVLWFNRGSKGFYAMNTSNSQVTGTFNVQMADGAYCDILGTSDPKNNPCGQDVSVTNGKVTITIPAKTAMAICTDEKWCGKGVDPCETDPSGAACVCKGSGTNSDGVCQDYCQINQNADGCYCLLNPTDDSCISIPQTKGNLCYAGTSNSWKFDQMTYNKRTGYWAVDVVLDGSAKQGFKIVDGCAWTGTVYGSSGTQGKLAVNTATDGNEYTTKSGSFTLYVKDSDMTYEFKSSGVITPTADFTYSVSGLTVQFTDGSSANDDGNQLSYLWKFGNGTTSTEKNPKVVYAADGSYTVTLTVTNTQGQSATKTQTVNVHGVTTAVYAKTAVRAKFDNYATHELTRESAESSVWSGTFTFDEDTQLKIEALPITKDQCIILGGTAGQALTASGDFIKVEAGEYVVKFDESTKVLTLTKKQHDNGNTKTNCDKDATTNNCESSDYAYTFLGAVYSKEATTFRLWSPDSGNVSVTVNNKTYTMTKTNINGYSDVYEVTVSGDLDGMEYQFKVNGKEVRDPYGKMVKHITYTTTSASNNTNVVMNMRDTDLSKGWAVRPEFKEREDAVIYEVHVRDFTIDSSSGVSSDKRGRYLGMVETGTTNSKGLKTGIDHLKDLGVTHVQLMPVYDYGTCSDVDSQSNSCYNWGYDPVNFNVPEDRYTSVFGTANYKQKVAEFKEMVNEFHRNGIRVIMDVVYNHTYSKEVFQNISSKYYTSIDLSGCGNSVDAKNDMVSRFIRDSLEYWATEYNIDGFRFDLVGIFDTQDFKEWGEYLNNKYPTRNFLMYGEPWNGYATDPSESTRVRLGNIRNAASGHVGVFNGKYRECLKGDSDGTKGGFLFNTTYSDVGDVDGNFGCVMAGIKGGIGNSTNTWTPLFAADPEQAIQYITAHDNLNWTDKIAKMQISGDYAKRLQSYGHGVLFVSQGIPFIHAGEEFGRSKKMNHNSYASADGSNDIDWNVKTSYKDTFAYYKGMIAMRKAHKAFRMNTSSQISQNISGYEQNGAVVVTINGEAVGDSWKEIKMVINSGNNLEISGVNGWYKKVHAVSVNEDDQTGTNVAEGTAVTIWYRK